MDFFTYNACSALKPFHSWAYSLRRKEKWMLPNEAHVLFHRHSFDGFYKTDLCLGEIIASQRAKFYNSCTKMHTNIYTYSLYVKQ